MPILYKPFQSVLEDLPILRLPVAEIAVSPTVVIPAMKHRIRIQQYSQPVWRNTNTND